MSNYAHELFLLSVNLSQFKSKVLVTKVFVESLTAIFNPHTFSWCDGEVDNNGSALEVCTKVKSYGYIEHTVSGSTTDEEVQLLQNAVQMLALLLEKLEQEQLLQHQKKHLSQLVDKRTSELANEKDALKEAKNRLQIVSDNMLDLVSLTDLEGNYKYTGASHQILGYDTDFFIGKNVMDFVHPDDLPEIQSQLTDFLTHKKLKAEAIYRYRTANGSYLWFETIGTFIFDVSGDPREILFNTRDITERKMIGDKLADEASRRRILMKQSRDGIVILDGDGKVVEFNKKFAEMLGYPLESMSRLTVLDWEFLHPPKQVIEMIRQVDEKGAHFETKHRRKDGSIYDVEITTNAAWFYGQKFIYCVCRDITERRKIEYELKKSEEKFAKAFHSSPNIIGISDIETGEYIDVNQTFYDVLEYTPVDIKGKKVKDLVRIDPSFRGEALKMLKEKGSVRNLETVIYSKTGKKVHILISADIIRVNNKEYNFTTAVNITELKQAEKELNISNQRLESFLQISQSIISPLDKETLMQLMVDKAAQATGVQSSAIYLINDKEAIKLEATAPALPPNFPNEFRIAYLTDHPHIHKAIATSQHVLMPDSSKATLTLPEQEIIRLRNLQSSLYLPINLRGNPIGVLILSSVNKTHNFSNEEISLLQGFANQVAQVIDNYRSYYEVKNYAAELEQNIIERKRAESQLRKLSQAVEQSPAIVVITNLEGNIEYVNPKFTEVTGYTPDAAIGQNPRILKSGEQTAEYYMELWQTISSGKEWRGEFHNKKKNGELFWEAASISPIVNSDGKTTHYLAVKEDITNRKKAEQELILAKEKAEENDRLKSAFLQNMSHEIRTPLNSIIGFSERINSPKITDEKRHLYSGIIVKSGLQLLSVVSDILLISTIDTGQEQLNIESICINLLISEVETVFKQQLGGKRVKLKSIVPLPNATAEILTDKTKLNQILTNLLSNAVKYTSVGEIKFGYNQKNNELEFFVKDNGIGIHESKHKVIFERFVQADDSIHIDYGGTGLGLSICKGYVELLGGKIWVESEPGKGATFLFTIPYKPYKTESGDDRYRC